MSNPIVYSTSNRVTSKSPLFSAPYGKNPANLYDTSERIVKASKIAHGLSEYRKELLRKAERVGMTLEQYCKRFNIKL